MSPDEMLRLKNELGLTYAMIAEKSGVPVSTVQKVLQGETKSPRYATLSALSDALREMRPRPGVYYDTEGKTVSGNVLREALPVYNVKQQGTYTIEDYYALPDNVRAELIDGRFFYMASPSRNHQFIAGEVHRQISNFIMENKGSCKPYISPIDVQLDQDDKTMVEPDVAIVCDPSIEKYRVIYGAPDFVLEVMSPSTSKKDATLKLRKYMQAGVREYWLVDPMEGMVTVYVFGDKPGFSFYDLFDEIPVRIYDGKLTICLKPIRDWLTDLAEEE